MIQRWRPIILTFLWLASPAHAEWSKVGTTAGNADYYLDAERIRVMNGKVRVWVKMNHVRERAVAYRTSMSLMAFDCAAQTWKVLSVTTYDSYGKTIESSPMQSDFGEYQPILPDSVGERISIVACAGAD